MWLILQQEEPDDYVLATGETHTVREFTELAFSPCRRRACNGAARASRRSGIDPKTGKVVVEIDPRYFRPTEVDLLLGDPRKAHQQLGWRHKTSFPELVREDDGKRSGQGAARNRAA